MKIEISQNHHQICDIIATTNSQVQLSVRMIENPVMSQFMGCIFIE